MTLVQYMKENYMSVDVICLNSFSRLFVHEFLIR